MEKHGKVKTIFTLINKPSTQLFIEKFNALFQTSSTSTVHKLYGESLQLLKTVLFLCEARGNQAALR